MGEADAIFTQAFRFSAAVVYWRGPAPFIFAGVPGDISVPLQRASSRISYGWGCIPVLARIADHEFTTALIPKDGRYLLPLKKAVRQKLPPMEIGDSLEVLMRVEGRMPKS